MINLYIMSYVELFMELSGLMDEAVFRERPLGWSGWYSLVANLIKKHISEVEFVGFYLPKEDHLQIGPYLGEYGLTPFLPFSESLPGKAYLSQTVQQEEDLTTIAVPLNDREGSI